MTIITPQHRPMLNYGASRPRPIGSRHDAVRERGPVDPHAETCIVQFFKVEPGGSRLAFEDTVPMIGAKPAQAVLDACQAALDAWRREARFPDNLRKRGFAADPEEWDEAAVNGKRFPRPKSL